MKLLVNLKVQFLMNILIVRFLVCDLFFKLYIFEESDILTCFMACSFLLFFFFFFWGGDDKVSEP